jgi:hypothetical protein
MNRQLLLRLVIVMLSVAEWTVVREVMRVRYHRGVYLMNVRFVVIGVRLYSRNEAINRVVVKRAILSVPSATYTSRRLTATPLNLLMTFSNVLSYSFSNPPSCLFSCCSD